jgi:hypothetical protein
LVRNQSRSDGIRLVWSLWRVLTSVFTLGKQFVQPCDFVVAILASTPSEPGLGIDTPELGGFDHSIGDGSRFAAALGAHKEEFFRPKATQRIDRLAE